MTSSVFPPVIHDHGNGVFSMRIELPPIVITQSNIDEGNCHIENSESTKAENCFNLALLYSKSLEGDVMFEQKAAALYGLGNVYLFLGKAKQAEDYYKDACSKIKQMKDEASKVHNLCCYYGSIANVHFKQGEDYHNQGRIDFEKKEYVEAEKAQNEGLKYAESFEDETSTINLRTKALYRLGMIFTRQKNWNQALNSFYKSLELAQKKEDQLLALEGIGVLLGEQENLESAIEFCEVALRKTKNKFTMYLMYNNLGYYEAKAKNFEKAEEHLKQSIEILNELIKGTKEEAQQVSFFEDHSRSYYMLVDVLISMGKNEEALLFADRAKAIALVNKLQLKLKTSESEISYEKIKNIAEKYNTTIIHYAFSFFKKETMFIWVVSPKKENPIFLEQLYPSTEIPDQITNGELFIDKSKRKEWYKILIQPLEKHLSSEQMISIVPDEFLHKMPFSVLMDSQEKCLIENHPLLFIPSCFSLELMRERRAQRLLDDSAEPLIIGNPTKDLNGAEEEGVSIQKVIGGKLLLNQSVKRETIQQGISNANYVHFACHGTQDYKLEYSSYSGALILSEGSHRDSMLFPDDLENSNIQAELVFMSACNSGKGTIMREGIMGLSRSILSAGCDSVISTHSKIPDPETVEFAVEFYKYLFGREGYEKLDKVNAMRQVMLSAIRKDKNKPQNWGAFYLMGLPDSRIEKESRKRPRINIEKRENSDSEKRYDKRLKAAE